MKSDVKRSVKYLNNEQEVVDVEFRFVNMVGGSSLHCATGTMCAFNTRGCSMES